MARGGGGPLPLLALAGLGLVGYQWAQTQPATSTARKAADQVRGAVKQAAAALSGAHMAIPAIPGAVYGAGGLSTPAAIATYTAQTVGTAPGGSIPHGVYTTPDGVVTEAPAPIPSGQPMQATSLVDFGGFPLVLDPNADALVQDPGQGGTNSYGPGDAVLNSLDGAQYTILAGRGGVILQGIDGSYPAVDQFFA